MSEEISFEVDPPDPKVTNYDRIKKRLARDIPFLPIVWRSDWGAVEPKERLPLDIPVKNVLLVYTESEPCKTDKACERIVKELQTEHMAKGSPDLPWNFMVGGNGKVYEGRGFNVLAEQTGEFVKYHGKSFDIAYIANARSQVNKKMKFIKGQLIRFGLMEWIIKDNFDFMEDKYDWEVMEAEKKAKEEKAERDFEKYKSSTSSDTELSSSFWSTTDEDVDPNKPKDKVTKRKKKKKKKKKNKHWYDDSEATIPIPVKMEGMRRECD